MRRFFNVRFEAIGSEARAARVHADATVAAVNALRTEFATLSGQVAALSEQVAHIAEASAAESDRLVSYLVLLGRTLDELSHHGDEDAAADDGDHRAA